MLFLGLSQYLELAAAIIGTIYYKKYSHTFLKYFLFLLWLVVGVEFSIWFLRQHYDQAFQNALVYNILTYIQFSYFFLLYYKIIKKKVYRKIVFALLILFAVSVALSLILNAGDVTSHFQSDTFTFGAAMLDITIGLFLVEILNSDKVLYFKKYLMFWISIGLVLYYTAIVPYFISLKFLPAFRSSDVWSFIIFTLNLMMYGSFIIGFIVSRKLED